MLESNTEAERTTGTGSKQGRNGGGVQLPLGTLREGTGVQPSLPQERHAQPASQGTRHKRATGRRRMARGRREQRPRSLPPACSPSLTPLNTHLCVSGWGSRRLSLCGTLVPEQVREKAVLRRKDRDSRDSSEWKERGPLAQPGNDSSN